MNPDTGRFHNVPPDKEAEAESLGWIRFSVGETIEVKGHPFRVVACRRNGRLELKALPNPKKG